MSRMLRDTLSEYASRTDAESVCEDRRCSGRHSDGGSSDSVIMLFFEENESIL